MLLVYAITGFLNQLYLSCLEILGFLNQLYLKSNWVNQWDFWYAYRDWSKLGAGLFKYVWPFCYHQTLKIYET